MYGETCMATLQALQLSADSNHNINTPNMESVKNFVFTTNVNNSLIKVVLCEQYPTFVNILIADSLGQINPVHHLSRSLRYHK